ncbi:MAG: UTP--glucose-1-phosphate uridylyltransferase [Actinobacteria bacterium]|nr:UTP--glucose-1-phosphate uridylyltransferase [Actinomycetota bacterium]
MRARTAVIPAAGMGTRFLPATKAVPKELLPILDQPALQLIIDEAAGAGIDHVVVVTSHAKPAIEAYFEPAPEVIAKLRSTGRDALADSLDRVGRDVRISFAYQDEARGLGHAVGCAREAVGDEPFAVLLPDELMGDSSLLAQMIDICERTSGSVVGLKRVPRDDVSAYGVIDPSGPIDSEGVVGVRTMVEKPKVSDAPSDLIIIGRYVLTPDVFDRIEQVQPGAGGEIQLTDALRMQAASGPFHGVLRDIRRYDTGNPLGWLTAVVELALDDPKIGPAFRDWLQERR